MPYKFVYKDWLFELWKFDKTASTLICTFPKDQMREVLEETADNIGESSKWIGAMVRIFHQTFTFPPSEEPPTTISDYSDIELIKYLRHKGYIVSTKNLHPNITDQEIINHLKNEGYEISEQIQEKGGKRIANEPVKIRFGYTDEIHPY